MRRGHAANGRAREGFSGRGGLSMKIRTENNENGRNAYSEKKPNQSFDLWTCLDFMNGSRAYFFLGDGLNTPDVFLALTVPPVRRVVHPEGPPGEDERAEHEEVRVVVEPVLSSVVPVVALRHPVLQTNQRQLRQQTNAVCCANKTKALYQRRPGAHISDQYIDILVGDPF